MLLLYLMACFNALNNSIYWPIVIIVYREALKDEDNFPEKNLAASIASKVFYYLEEYEESLRLALEAGNKFDLNERIST